MLKPDSKEQLDAEPRTCNHYSLDCDLIKRLGEGGGVFCSLFEAAPVSIFGVREGALAYVNPAGARLLGFSRPEEMLGVPVMDLVAEESRTLAMSWLQNLAAGRANPPEEMVLRQQSGTEVTVESTSVAFVVNNESIAFVFALDISERCERDRMLRLMKCTVDHALDRIAWIAPDGRFLYANHAACREMKYTLEEVLSMRVSDIDPNFSQEVWLRHYQEIKEAGDVRLQTRQIDAEGALHHIDVRSKYIPARDDAFVCSFGRDITELKVVEEKLLEYKHVIESMKNPVAVVDSGYRFSYVNTAYADMFSRPVEEIIGRSVPELIGPEFFAQEIQHHYDGCFAGEPVSLQIWYEFPGKGRRLVDIRYYPFRGSTGEISAVVSSIHDITAIKELEINYRESEARFHAFMDNNPAAVYIKDDEDKHVYINPACAEIMGKTVAEIVGRRTVDLFPPETAKKLCGLDRKVLTENVYSVSEEWQVSKGGELQWIRDIKFPIHLESGAKLLGGIAVDTTKIREKEQQLEKAMQQITALKERLELENVSLREELGQAASAKQVVGESEAIRSCLELAKSVAGEQTTVLVQGETGTGKELLAQYIHNTSARRKRAMVKVNCAALPANLIESELFGREKGAFTGAMARQEGRFQVADGSTIFLDEIGDLPIELQSKLLRVLQEGSFERLGSSQTTTVDVRIIAATNHDLKGAVKEGRFRKDLYYRLNVFPITVPPLRDRVGDIPLLTWAFVSQFNNSMGKSVVNIPTTDMERLTGYSWPGNVRELKNHIERSMILCSGPDLKIGRIEVDDFEEPPVVDSNRLVDIERHHIHKVLAACGWRVSGKNGAAEILGLKPTTLEARMKKLGITRPG